MRSKELADMTNAARDMALAVEIQFPVNALTRNQKSLALLIERAAAGDTSAFEQIMIQSQQKVITLSWRMLGNEADARDASQEVFLRVYKYLGRYKHDQDFFGWLYRITINVCRDTLKKRQRENECFAANESEEALSLPMGQADAEQILDEMQRHDLIARAIATLPDKERASILLRDVEGFSTEEVGRILKSRPTTVRSQISSARKKIKEYCRKQLKGNEWS